jgi:hypothetical protein
VNGKLVALITDFIVGIIISIIIGIFVDLLWLKIIFNLVDIGAIVVIAIFIFKS